MINLVILGAGGFGKEVHVWAEDLIQQRHGVRVKGFLEDDPEKFNVLSEMPLIIWTSQELRLHDALGLRQI